MRQIVNQYDTYTILWGRVDGGEMLRFLYKALVKNASPTDSLFQDYDYAIAKSSGGNGSPMLDFAQRLVAPQDRHSKCLRGSRSP